MTAGQLLSEHRNKLIATAGGVSFALATPPTDVYPLIFVGLLGYALLVQRAASAWAGFGLGWLWATGANIVGMRFVPSVIELFTPLGTAAGLGALVLLSAAQAIHWGLGAAAGVLLRKRLGAPLEVAAAAATLIAVSLPSVFLWTPAGLLSPWPILVQAADIVGERGVSALFAALMAALIRTAGRLRRDGKSGRLASLRPALVAISIFALLVAYGGFARARYASPESADGEARLGLVHPGVDPRERWESRNWPRILSSLRNLTSEVELAGVDLSVWPEAAYPYPLPYATPAAPRGQRAIVGGAVDGPVLFGYVASLRPFVDDRGVEQRNLRNSATIVMPDRRLLPSYDKMELLWFGETVPLGEHLPFLKRAFQRSGGFVPGAELRRLDLSRPRGAALELGVLNCYEDTLPDLGRRIAVELSPNLLVNVTNDAWFVGTAAPELHLRLSVMRAIELRRDLVRAVNLGVRGWIDAAGTVRARDESPEPGWRVVTPMLRSGPPTVYARFGDVPAFSLLAAASVLSGWQRRRRRALEHGPAETRDNVSSR